MDVAKPIWHNVKGLPMIRFFIGEDEFDELLKFNPKQDDIFLVTYPKCGTTWTQYIIWEIINRGAPLPGMNKMVFEYFPHVDIIGTEVLYTLKEPRLFKSHLPCQYLPIKPQAKYVFVLRNPWDCCVSYYYHTLTRVEGELPFDVYFDAFIEGNLPFGNYLDHVLSCLKYQNEPNVYFVYYEELKKDPRYNILKIAEFLDPKYKTEMEEDDKILTNILEHTKFNYMKDNVKIQFSKNKPKSREAFLKIKNEIYEASPLTSKLESSENKEEDKGFSIFRKGQIGDYKIHMTEGQKKRLQLQIKEKITDNNLVNYWNTFMS